MIRTVSAIVFALAIYGGQPVKAAELHVAPGGTEDASGTAERPLADLEQARDIIRAWKKNGKVIPSGADQLPTL